MDKNNIATESVGLKWKYFDSESIKVTNKTENTTTGNKLHYIKKIIFHCPKKGFKMPIGPL